MQRCSEKTAMRATESGHDYMSATVSSKWQTLEMGHYTHKWCPLCHITPYHKEQVWKSEKLLRGNSFWTVRAKYLVLLLTVTVIISASTNISSHL